MMKFFQPLLFLLLLSPLSSVAQSNYTPGYVVKLNGDTIKGYIDYHTWIENPKTINFKTGLDSTIAVVPFSTANSVSFTVTGFDRYERFIITMSHDHINGFNVSKSIDTKNAIDTVFLKVLDRGKFLTLYSYNDKLKLRFFIAENKGQPVELGFHAYIDANGSGETKFAAFYKRQLESLAVKYRSQDPSIINDIETAGYTADDLDKIVFEINGSDKQSTYVAAAQFKSRALVGLGVNLLTAHNYDPYYSLHYAPAVEITLGEDVFFSRAERSIFLRTVFELAYSAGNKVSTSYGDTLLEKYNALTINLNPQLYINVYSGKGVKIYLAGGFEVFIRTSGTITYTNPSLQGNDVDLPYRFTLNLSLTTRAELDINHKYGFYLGIDPVSNIGQKYNNISTFHAGVNYFFSK